MDRAKSGTPVSAGSPPSGSAEVPISPLQATDPGKRRATASLRRRLVSLVLACVLPMWVIAGLLVYNNYRTRRVLTEERLLESARLQIQAVDRELSRMQGGLAVLATTPSLQTGDLAVFQRRAQIFASAYPGADIVLADVNGQQLVNSGSPLGVTLPKRSAPDAVEQIFATGQPFTTGMYHGSITGRTLISVDVPVFRGGQVIYDLGMAVPTSHFNLILEEQHFPKEWLGVVYDPNQVMVARTRSEQFVGQHGHPVLGQRMKQGREGVVEIVGRGETPLLTAFSRSSTSGWSIALAVPKAVIMAGVRWWLGWTTAGVILLSLIGILLAFRMARHIAGSIHGLIPPALALGRGEPVAVEHLDLAEANQVAESLTRASELIQQRVEERAIAEAARREAEELKRLNMEMAAISDAVPTIMFIAHDQACQLVTSNRAGYALLQLPAGTKLSPFEKAYVKLQIFRSGGTSENDLPLVEAARTGQEVRDCECTVILKDGNARKLFGNAVPLLDDKGAVRGAVSAYIDITDRERAEAALRESEERYRSLFENSMDAILFITPDGGINAANPAACALFGMSEEEICRAGRAGIIDPEDPNHAVALEQRARTGIMNAELSYRRKDGTKFMAEVGSVVMEGQPRRAFVVLRDITARRRAEQEHEKLQAQLLQAQKMESVGRLAGGVAHDFNNLLLIIRSYTEMLQDKLALSDPLQKYTHQVINAVDRAAGLTGQLLAFSRKQVISPVVLDLNRIVSDTAKMMHRLIGEDIELRLATAESLWPIEADPDQIAQVLINLSVNARDAMPQGGELTIETRNVTVDGQDHAQDGISPGEYVALRVSDTGMGIRSDIKDRVFEPFFTTKEVGKGTGLGLSTVYGIVKQSGGHIWVESESGSGAAFTIYLPRSKRTQIAEPLAALDSGLTGRETLLVVEDEANLREAICEFLRGQGYEVLAADSGQKALAVAAEYGGRIDLLLSDVVMPKMSGRELSALLKAQRPDLKVLLMSGYTEDAVIRHGVEKADTAFLQKPFKLATLAHKVRDVLMSSGS